MTNIDLYAIAVQAAVRIAASSKQELEEYAFALDWFEDHRKVSLAKVKKHAKKYPFSGEAFRVSKEGNFGPKTSWSKTSEALKSYSRDKPHKEKISGLDLEELCRNALKVDPKNSDLLDIIKVKEVVKV